LYSYNRILANFILKFRRSYFDFRKIKIPIVESLNEAYRQALTLDPFAKDIPEEFLKKP